jgi:outer membrane autotransporter protein
MRFKLCAVVPAIALFVSLPVAHAQIFRATLNGQNEIPAADTPATGFGIITLNRTAHGMRVNANFTGLRGTTTASHIHCCAAQPANVGVATTVPTFVGFPLGVTSGSWDQVYDMTLASTWNPAFMTANGGTPAGAESAFLTGVLAGQSYLNIHTSMFIGGEIRGTLQLFSFAANAALSTRTSGVAGALDSLGAGTGDLNTALVNMAFLSPAQQAAALARLTPSSSRGRLAATTGNFDANFDMIDNRLDGIRWEDRAQRPSDSGGGIWFGGHGINNRQYEDAGFAGYDNHGWGLVGGVDHRLDSGTVYGAALGYFDTDLNYRNEAAGNNDDIRSTQLSGYLGHHISRFFIQGGVGYAWQKYDGSRDTGATGIATASFKGHQWGARVGFGTPIDLSSSVTFTPQVRLNWANVKHDAYDESGGGPFGLAVAAKSVDRFRGSVGAQFDFGDNMGSGFRIRPFLRGFWSRDVDSKERDTTASFLAGGSSFVTPGQKLDQDPIALGAGANFFTEGAFSAGVNYDLTLGNSNQSSVLQARVHWSF